MAKGNDIQTTLDPNVEEVNLTFDFGPAMEDTSIITNVINVECSVYVGVDPAASSRILGTPQITDSEVTGNASQAVIVSIGFLLANTTYNFGCQCQTADGQRLSLTTHITCR